MTKIHLDTDIGGDLDDVCVLAMLLQWPDLDITGVTTVCEEFGRRAGYVQYVLSLVGRSDIPFAAGAELFAKTAQFEQKFGQAYPGIPGDIINFQHDPLACAIALGWREGVEIETAPLIYEVRDTYLYEARDSSGTPTRMVTQVDGSTFNEYWYDMICR